MSEYHIPVLLNDSVDGLNMKAGGVYVDATYGGGGHSAAILRKLTGGKLYAIDQDEDAAKNLPESDKFFFIHGNFRYLKNYMAYFGVTGIDGLLADLGVSSHHFNTPERGFTYRADTLLDMRMNRNSKLTAGMVINEYSDEKLTEVFRNYGELGEARKLAIAIVKCRLQRSIDTTGQLVESIRNLIPRKTENQFLAKVFQAIRIEVNHEMESLEEMLAGATELLNPGGRLVIISYHSLEDRMVKNFMRWGNAYEEPVKDIYGHTQVPYRVITRKPVEANADETAQNPRSRSARLRIAEKK
ncbi:MAG: 16S rRNA (cytosine(1402)-N(4))-methyltransferase RsmH [Bacteroidales bacterium]|nr:16S rRNA (cytosine(1402)-N(4))-methyltransferase RsmH [Bacteroidales bacterium]